MKQFNIKELGSYLLRGTFIMAPIFFTIYVIFQILSFIDSPVQELFYAVFNIRIYGLGLLTVIITLIGIGYFGTTVLVNSMFKSFEQLIFKIPFVKEIYTALKDIIGAFVSDKKKFEKPVLVEIQPGIHRIGFITNENLKEFHITDESLIAVYFPFSYALTGELLIIRKDLIKAIKTDDIKGLMKFTISGAIINKDDFHSYK